MLLQEQKEIFRKQIKEDIELLKEKLSYHKNIEKDEYAFNSWVLVNIFNLDEEDSLSNITEYNDKEIDCWVHFKDKKELFLIQNKYYEENTNFKVEQFSSFLSRPLASLQKGNYKSKDLQEAFNEAKENKDYSIKLCFFLTQEKGKDEFKHLIKDFNSTKREDIKASLECSIFLLKDIHQKYYGETFKEDPNFIAKFTTKNRGTYLRIAPKEYDLEGMTEAFYVMTPVTDIFHLCKRAKEKNYELFEENIREYLGGSRINKKIIETLKNENEKERKNFFYYNNGITIICDEVKTDSGSNRRTIKITKPQIVNGCQTVNSIFDVIKKYKDKEKYTKDFESTFVMVKILEVKERDKDFYRDVVKYTNSQNAINEKVFGAVNKPFYKIQDEFKKRGILLLVKQSDRHQFLEKEHNEKTIEKCNKLYEGGELEFKKFHNCYIQLENFLQAIGAFEKDAHFAYTKKSKLLIPTNKIYQEFSTRIQYNYTIEAMLKIVFLYKKSEYDRKQNDDKRFPAPYYLLNFLGYYLKKREINMNDFLTKTNIAELLKIYNIFKYMPKKYYSKLKEYYSKLPEKNDFEYNLMIKREVDKDIISSIVKDYLSILKGVDKDKYDELDTILKKINGN